MCPFQYIRRRKGRVFGECSRHCPVQKALMEFTDKKVRKEQREIEHPTKKDGGTLTVQGGEGARTS